MVIGCHVRAGLWMEVNQYMRTEMTLNYQCNSYKIQPKQSCQRIQLYMYLIMKLQNKNNVVSSVEELDCFFIGDDGLKMKSAPVRANQCLIHWNVTVYILADY